MIGLLALASMFLALLLYELKRRVPVWPLSPVWLVVGGYLTIGFVGRYALWAAEPYGDAFLFVTFSKRAMDLTLLWFIFVTASFALGALLSIWVSQRPDLPVEFPAGSKRQGGGSWLLLAFGTLVLFIIGVGPKNVLDRSVYLTGAGTAARIAAGGLMPLAIGLCGYATLGFEGRLTKIGGVLVTLGFFILTFSLATRLMALVPVLFAVGACCAQPGSRSARILFYGGILAAPILLPVPLILRNLGEQGLVPFISVMRSGLVLFKNRSVLGTVLGNVLASFPLTTYVGHRAPLRLSVLLTCLNPMPGKFTDWYETIPTVLVNSFTPFNTVGMLMNYGALIGGGFYIVVGFYFSHLDWKIRQGLCRGQVLRSLVLFGFSALFLPMTMQYPLRMACRFVYYAIAFESLSAVLSPEVRNGRAGLVARY